MAELANCTRCGKVFAKHIRDICEECFKKEEKDFETVYSFLKKRENREANLQEIAQETGVEEYVIIKFIKTKRLRTIQFPKLAYPCEKCGVNIVSGRFCADCHTTLLRGLEENPQGGMRCTKNENVNVYYSLQKREN